MNSLDVVFYLSILVWIGPAVRQFNARYQYPFLVLALTDPITLAIMMISKAEGWAFPFHPYHILVPLFFASFYFREEIKKPVLWGGIFIAALIGSYVAFGASPHIMMAINLLVVVELFKRAFTWINKRDEVNVFHFVFILYILSGLIKFGYFGSALAESAITYTVTTAYQFLVAAFYTYYREETPRLAIKISQPSDAEKEPA